MFSPPNYSAPRSFLAPRLGPWTIELYFHRWPILEAVRDAACHLQGTLLDVGSGIRPYEPLVRARVHVGLDVFSTLHRKSRLEVRFDGTRFPFRNESFDAALCTEVVEHAGDPQALVDEIARVLRPGGHALVTAPMFIHHHEEPHDYQRFTRYGMERLARRSGLEIVWLRPRGGPYSTAVAAVHLAITRSLSRRPLIDVLLWALWPLAVLALHLDRRIRRPPEITLGWQMLVRAPAARSGVLA